MCGCISWILRATVWLTLIGAVVYTTDSIEYKYIGHGVRLLVNMRHFMCGGSTTWSPCWTLGGRVRICLINNPCTYGFSVVFV